LEPSTGNTKGFCFLEYSTVDAAEAAVKALDNYFMGPVGVGRNIKVGRPNSAGGGTTVTIPAAIASAMAELGPSDRIYVGRIHEQINSEQIRTVFAAFGNILSCEMISKLGEPKGGVHRGFGFIRYESPEHAKEAIDNMNGFVLAEMKILVGRMPNSDTLSAAQLALDAESASSAGAPGVNAGDANQQAENDADAKGEEQDMDSEDVHISKGERAKLQQRGRESKCIVLYNMVDYEEADTEEKQQELKVEILTECERVGGTVKEGHVYITEDEEVKIFALFESKSDATTTINTMNGRNFGGRKVVAKAYPEQAYKQGQFVLGY